MNGSVALSTASALVEAVGWLTVFAFIGRCQRNLHVIVSTAMLWMLGGMVDRHRLHVVGADPMGRLTDAEFVETARGSCAPCSFRGVLFSEFTVPPSLVFVFQ